MSPSASKVSAFWYPLSDVAFPTVPVNENVSPDLTICPFKVEHVICIFFSLLVSCVNNFVLKVAISFSVFVSDVTLEELLFSFPVIVLVIFCVLFVEILFSVELLFSNVNLSTEFDELLLFYSLLLQPTNNNANNIIIDNIIFFFILKYIPF